MKKKDKEQKVKIKKLQKNYELRFDYLKILSEFIKSLPREHRETKVTSYKTPDGGNKKDFIRIVRDVEMGKIITFMIDNSIDFYFENITKPELNRLRQEYKDRQKRIKNALKLKENKIDISKKDEDYSYLNLEPYYYQKEAIKFFEINEGKAILADQPGVGKTLPVLAYAAKHGLKTLIISPATLKLNWRKEILKFTNEKPHVYKYFPSKRSGKVNYNKDDSLFHIINYESIENFIKLEYKHKCKGNLIDENGKNKGQCKTEIIDIQKKIKECPNCGSENSMKTTIKGIKYFINKDDEYIDPDEYDLIALDECHRIKNSDTTWTKIIQRAFRDNIDKKLLLSGTLIKSKPIELFNNLNFIDPNEWNNKHFFAIRYAAAYEDNFGWDYSGASNLEELFERISPIFLRRLKKDILSQLPEKTHTVIPVELRPNEYKQYNKIENKLKKEVKEDNNEQQEEKEEKPYISIVHELKQYTEKVKINRSIEMIEDIIDSGEKVVVFCNYIETANMMKEKYKDKLAIHTGNMNDTEKQDSIDSFQENDDIKIFCGTIDSSSEGITLNAASKAIFLGLAWTPSDMEQAEDRIHRATNTSDSVDIIKLICELTIDEDIDNLLKEKSKIVNKVLDNKEFEDKSNVTDEDVFKNLLKRIEEK